MSDAFKQDDHKNQTLRYLLNILENTTSVEELRSELDCKAIFEMVKDMYKSHLSLENKKSLINIIFNLNFNLETPSELGLNFLKMLYETYKDPNLVD